MKSAEMTDRRAFLGRVFGAAAAASLPGAAAHAAAVQESGPDDWIKELKGTHRCLFDFPQHNFGMPLLHILNYLNTYGQAYKAAPGQVGAAGTFYGLGGRASIPLAFNDTVWEKYSLGEYTGLKDASGKPYTRNVFNRPFSRPTFPRWRKPCRASPLRTSRRWVRSSCCATTRSGPGAWSSKQGGRGRRRISRKICARTSCLASSRCRRW